MRKSIIIILSLFVCVFATAQDKTFTLVNETYVDFSFDDSDTVITSTDYSIVITGSQHVPQCQNVYIDIDSVSGTPTMDISLQGRVFTTDSWTTIGSAVSWAGTGDTAFTIANATANRYRYYRIFFDVGATAQKAKVMDVQFKLWRE